LSVASVEGVSQSRRISSLYRPELDALRFFAFFCVFIHHVLPRSAREYQQHLGPTLSRLLASITNAGSFGLCLFFVLSAYLISELLIRERLRTGTVHIKSFYTRRMLRIWPLYFFGVGIGLLWAVLSGVRKDVTRFLSYLVLAGNWYCTKNGWTRNPMVPLWSISIEEQFYLLWPAIARKTGEKGMYTVCAIMLADASGWLFYLTYTHATPDWSIWANTFVQFSMFAAGVLLALSLRGNVLSVNASSRILLALAGLGAWFISAYFLHCKDLNVRPTAIQLNLGYLLVALGCVSLLCACLGLGQAVPAALVYLGRISYGLYVFHLLALWIAETLLTRHVHQYAVRIVATGIAGFLLTVAMAAVSYRYLETPFLRLKEKFSYIKTRPV